jgi:hypothetical protein
MKNYLKMFAGAGMIFLPLTTFTTVAGAQTCTVDWNNVHQRIDGFVGFYGIHLDDQSGGHVLFHE